MKHWLGVVCSFVLMCGMIPAPVGAQAASQSQILIHEIKLGGPNPASVSAEQPIQYVSLYNTSNQPIDLASFRLEYAKTTFNKQFCMSPEWKAYGATEKPLSGTLPASVDGLAGIATIELQLTDNKGGSVRLVQAGPDTVTVHDNVGWNADAPCFEGTAPAALPAGGSSIKRMIDCQAILIDTNRNDLDFVAGQVPSPSQFEPPFIAGCQTSEPELPPETVPPVEPDIPPPLPATPPAPPVPPQQPTPDSEVPIEPPPVSEPSPTPPPVANAVIISELLPDPDAALAEQEFVELYNSGQQAVNLAGYTLKSSSGTGNTLVLPELIIQPGGYEVVAGLTLTNSGGYVWLADPLDAIVAQSESYSTAKKGVSWALVDGVWQAAVPSPSAVNLALPSVSANTSTNPQTAAPNQLEPCEPGKSRNPETNRCKSDVATASVLAPCQPGQTRNEQTNRCRNASLAVANLTACKEGQYRNPETNRCKSTESAEASLVACKSGQERNPDTNRCRAAGSSTANAASINAASETKNPITAAGWMVAGAAGVGALGYGAYEWRHGLLGLLRRIRG